jgi:hypothetical protein
MALGKAPLRLAVDATSERDADPPAMQTTDVALLSLSAKHFMSQSDDCYDSGADADYAERLGFSNGPSWV